MTLFPVGADLCVRPRVNLHRNGTQAVPYGKSLTGGETPPLQTQVKMRAVEGAGPYLFLWENEKRWEQAPALLPIYKKSVPGGTLFFIRIRWNR